ncbi:MAG: nitronate monooxygenase [Chloroflexi bacterium]|nr:nitronate monooxygenase [Chloroflexota bacterium]
MLRTPLCDVFGIEYPIINAGMGMVAEAELAAAVANAGGLGIVACGSMEVDEMEQQLKKARSLTNKPVGVDLVFPARGASADSGWKLPDPLPEPILRARAEMEAKGVKVPTELPTTQEIAYTAWQRERKKAELALEMKVAAIGCGLGTPEWLIKEAKARGIKMLSLVGNIRNAQRVEAMGVDFVVAQGHEAGGHCGKIPALVLVHGCVNACNIPIIAAGGITHGRQIAAVLALGAVGVWVGTRFIPSPESGAPEWHKQEVLNANENSTIYTKVYDGLGHRHLKSRFDELWEGHENEILDFPHQHALMGPIYHIARHHDIPEFSAKSCGMGATFVNRRQPAGEIVRQLVLETVDAIEALPKYIVRT